jgi:PKD repeat protein
LDWERQREQDNKSPEAVTGGPYTANEGSQVVLDGRKSKDSDGNIVLYEWDLDYRGNSFTADLVGPVVSPSFPDGPTTVTVALRVTDNRNARDVATAKVKVQNTPPVANAGGPYSGRVNQQVTLMGTGIDAGLHDQGQLIYTWNFGDGSTANGRTVSHSYAQAGNYNVTLTVTDKDGGRGSATTTIQINGATQPPQAVINGPAQGIVGSAVGFSGGSSSDSDGNIVKYAWKFGDGANDTGIEVSHTYDAPGNYTVTLVVTDNDGLTAKTTKSIQIENQTPSNQAPTAVINGPAAGVAGKALSFSGGSSSDSDGNIVKYAWKFGDGTNGQGVEVNHTYDAPGAYTVQLVVTDNGGLTGKTTKSIQIEAPAPQNKPPTAVITGPAKGIAGETVNFSAGNSSDNDGQIVKYNWNFGDGTTGNGLETSHTYDAPGNYNVTLVVTDNGGLTGKVTKPIQIQQPAPVNIAPTAVITGPATGVIGQALTFNGNNSTDSDGTITGYSWDFGDGTVGNGPVITHTYTLNGNYQVVLTVTDNGGLSSSAAQVIQINEAGKRPSDAPGNPDGPPPGQNPNLPSRSG